MILQSYCFSLKPRLSSQPAHLAGQCEDCSAKTRKLEKLTKANYVWLPGKVVLSPLPWPWPRPRPLASEDARTRLRRSRGQSALPWAAPFCCACSAPTAWPGPERLRASSSGPSPRSGRPAPRDDGALLCPPGHHLHHVLGPHRHRRALVRAERTQPRGDHHHAGSHCCVLLPLLAHRHPGPAEPPVRAAAEERDHLVRALPLGVTAAASAQVPQLSG